MELAIASLTLLAAIGLTYFFCVQPMRNGQHCGMRPPRSKHSRDDKATTGVTAHDVQAARDKLATLRAELDQADGGALASASEATRGRTSETAAHGSSPVDPAR